MNDPRQAGYTAAVQQLNALILDEDAACELIEYYLTEDNYAEWDGYKCTVVALARYDFDRYQRHYAADRKAAITVDTAQMLEDATLLRYYGQSPRTLLDVLDLWDQSSVDRYCAKHSLEPANATSIMCYIANIWLVYNDPKNGGLGLAIPSKEA